MNIYCQGRIVPEKDATISASDHGFLYGASLFETFRTFGGQPFLLEKHLERLTAGCRGFNILLHPDLLVSQPPPHVRLRQTLRELLDANDLDDAVFRYTLSAGEAPGGLPNRPYENAVEVIFVRPLPPSANAAEGIRLHILDTIRTGPEMFPRPKSGQYMNSLAGRWELLERSPAPGDEGLMLTANRHLSEGIVSNLFLVTEDGSLATPPLSAHILPGITRAAILDLARKNDIETTERNLTLSDLTTARAIFMTNSVRGIIPVRQVLDQSQTPIWQQNSAEDETVKQLRASYAALQQGFTSNRP